MRVTDQYGETWRVGRRWLPWKRRIRRVPTSDWLDSTLTPDGDGPIATAISLILLAITLVLLVPTLLAILGVVIEFALLLALVPVVVLIRVALGRPWTVQVIGPDRKARHTEPVVGWTASGERIQQLAERIRTGEPGFPPV